MAAANHPRGPSTPENKAIKVMIYPIASYTHRSRVMAHRASDSAAFRANQVRSIVPISAAPYSLAANVPAGFKDAPKREYTKTGAMRIGTPRARHTT